LTPPLVPEPPEALPGADRGLKAPEMSGEAVPAMGTPMLRLGKAVAWEAMLRGLGLGKVGRLMLPRGVLVTRGDASTVREVARRKNAPDEDDEGDSMEIDLRGVGKGAGVMNGA
jgi:hypothetical protein